MGQIPGKCVALTRVRSGKKQEKFLKTKPNKKPHKTTNLPKKPKPKAVGSLQGAYFPGVQDCQLYHDGVWVFWCLVPRGL